MGFRTEQPTVSDLFGRDLKSIKGREVCCYSISAKKEVNIDMTLDWLIKHAKKNG